MHSNLTQEFNELRNDYDKVLLLNGRFAERNLKDMDRMFELEQQCDALRVELSAVRADMEMLMPRYEQRKLRYERAETELVAVKAERDALKIQRDSALLDANVMREIWNVLD